ncbi:hypothetical protein NT05HA_2266 [Aggregatibacter aphrophilus NJ8700]|nr:hypothetical protein NT05HA_2266 [Aggregatibacter aphrophilus NJ8700]
MSYSRLDYAQRNEQTIKRINHYRLWRTKVRSFLRVFFND